MGMSAISRMSEGAANLHSVLASPTELPGFWIFMYRVSPFTYLVSAVLSTGVAGTTVHCSDIELLEFPPPPGETCGSYLSSYVKMASGRVLNPNDASHCKFCPISRTDQFLATLNIHFDERWRNVGLLFVYVVFNLFAAVFLYWLVRVPKKRTSKSKKE